VTGRELLRTADLVSQSIKQLVKANNVIQAPRAHFVIVAISPTPHPVRIANLRHLSTYASLPPGS
jgi:hypothetical protein